MVLYVMQVLCFMVTTSQKSSNDVATKTFRVMVHQWIFSWFLAHLCRWHLSVAFQTWPQKDVFVCWSIKHWLIVEQTLGRQAAVWTQVLAMRQVSEECHPSVQQLPLQLVAVKMFNYDPFGGTAR